MSEVVKLAVTERCAVVTIDSPTVNALSAAVRRGIVEQVETANADAAVDSIVIACAGRTFVAGADITEFGKPPQSPSANEVIAALESCSKPVIAAIHGTALGGGLELALGCHFRVATKDARLGLPEVKLGLLPGAGGTQRLPRAVGPEFAVKMIVTGEPVGAAEARERGLIDDIVDALVDGAVAFAKRVVTERRPLRVLATTTPGSRMPGRIAPCSPPPLRRPPRKRAA